MESFSDFVSVKDPPVKKRKFQIAKMNEDKMMAFGWVVEMLADSFCVPEGIGKIREFTAKVQVWNTQVVPILVFSGNYVKRGASCCDYSFVKGIGMDK